MYNIRVHINRENNNGSARVLVIIPSYNEESSIRATVNELREKAPGVDILAVNDCSTDNTQGILTELHVKHLRLPINLGIGGAVQAGYKFADLNGYDVAVQLDADGQHDPAYISALIAPILSGEADLVTGSRFIEKEGLQTSGMRRFGIKFLNGLIRLVCGVKVTDATSGFRAVSRRLIVLYGGEYPTDYPEPEAIVMAKMNKMKIMEIPVVMRDRLGGQSSIKFFNSVYYMIKVSIAIVLRRLQ